MLKLHSDASPRQGRIVGRLEHVASGRQFQFTSGEELLACLHPQHAGCMTQGQSVMLATNEIMATCALAFCVAAR